MTVSERPVCYYPEPCGCYAEGYAAGCSCEPCLVARAVRDAALPIVFTGEHFTSSREESS